MTKTILLADDSLTIQKVVELTFADTQYHVVSLSGGDELLDKLDEIQPELVICDIIMPGRDGYDVCQQIKSNPETLHIPVILLSGTFEPFDRDRALAAGCSEIITKPFEAKRLVDAVEKLLSPASTDVDRDDQEPESFGFADAPDEEEALSPAVDFGTKLAASDPIGEAAHEGLEEPEDAIDFTTSGFAEMEAAAQLTQEPPSDHSPHGTELAVDDGDGVSELAADESLAAAGDEDFADAFSIGSPSIEIPASGNGADQPDPFGASDDQGSVATSLPDEDGPFASEFGGSGDELLEGAGTAPDAISDDPDPVPEFEVKSAEEAFDMDPSPVIITDADTAPVPSLPDEDEDSEPEAIVSAALDAEFALSDDDVERIARRVIELASDRIEHIAWEVIPDVAEVVVRERIRRLESEFETEN